jgi:hypothetical protein
MVSKKLIPGGQLNASFDTFCWICDNFCKGNVQRRGVKGAEFYLVFDFNL